MTWGELKEAGKDFDDNLKVLLYGPYYGEFLAETITTRKFDIINDEHVQTKEICVVIS